MDLWALGTVTFLQVAPCSVKVAGEPEQYNPASLAPVDQLLMNSRGPMGITHDGCWLMDVHHADHPQTRNRQLQNSTSINFTSHYDAMRARFGAHIADGYAAENILVACAPRRTLADLGTFVMIHQPGTPHLVILASIKVAEPCLPFARYALQMPDAPTANVKDGLRFLRAGMRGFYLRSLEERVHHIERGATVYSTNAPTFEAARQVGLALIQRMAMV